MLEKYSLVSFASSNILIYTTSDNTVLRRKELGGSSTFWSEIKITLLQPCYFLHIDRESPQYLFVGYHDASIIECYSTDDLTLVFRFAPEKKRNTLLTINEEKDNSESSED